MCLGNVNLIIGTTSPKPGVHRPIYMATNAVCSCLQDYKGIVQSVELNSFYHTLPTQ